MSQRFNNSSYVITSESCAQTAFSTLHLMLQGILDFRTEGDSQALAQFSAISIRGGTCGAVAGCIAALGLALSRDEDKFTCWAAYLESLSPALEFCQNFEKRFGGTLCCDVMQTEFGRKYDLEDTDQAAEWMNSGAASKCGALILDAVKIAEEIIFARVSSGWFACP